MTFVTGLIVQRLSTMPLISPRRLLHGNYEALSHYRERVSLALCHLYIYVRSSHLVPYYPDSTHISSTSPVNTCKYLPSKLLISSVCDFPSPKTLLTKSNQSIGHSTVIRRRDHDKKADCGGDSSSRKSPKFTCLEPPRFSCSIGVPSSPL